MDHDARWASYRARAERLAAEVGRHDGAVHTRRAAGPRAGERVRRRRRRPRGRARRRRSPRATRASSACRWRASSSSASRRSRKRTSRCSSSASRPPLPEVLALSEADVRSLVGPPEALECMRTAFAALHRGEVTQPANMDFAFPDANGEAHLKGAHVHGSPYWAVKAATGFWGNPDRGLPLTNGLFLVFSAETGILSAILFDNGYLTELRTGAAGALAADLLAPARGRAGGDRRRRRAGPLPARGAPRRANARARGRRVAQRRRRVRGRDARAARHRRLRRAGRRDRRPLARSSSSRRRRRASPSSAPSGCSPARTSRRWARTSRRSRSSRRRSSRAPTSSPATIRPSSPRTAKCITRSTTARSRSPTSSRSARSSTARRGRTGAEQITVADLCGVGVQDAAVAAEVMRRAAGAGHRQDDRAVSVAPAPFQPFEMERWQSLYEHEVELNLADSAVRCAPLGMLLGPGEPRGARGARALLSTGQRHRPSARR